MGLLSVSLLYSVSYFLSFFMTYMTSLHSGYISFRIGWYFPAVCLHPFFNLCLPHIGTARYNKPVFMLGKIFPGNGRYGHKNTVSHVLTYRIFMLLQHIHQNLFRYMFPHVLPTAPSRHNPLPYSPRSRYVSEYYVLSRGSPLCLSHKSSLPYVAW